MDEQIKPVGLWRYRAVGYDADTESAFLERDERGALVLHDDAQQSIDALRAELAEQCRLHAIGMERELALIGRADRAEAEAKALREDGERYRWLRDLPDESPHECISTMPGDMWDAAIDAARKGAE